MTLNSKFVFFGGNKLSTIVLHKLIEKNIRPDLIISTPDKLIGKKRILTPPPLIHEAQNLKLETSQSESLKNNEEITKKIKELKPTFGIVAAYPKLIPKNILDIFPKGVLNLHPSLLPKHRGPSPIQSAILNNDAETGVSVILLDEQMDHGQILEQKKIKLTKNEYFPELYAKLADLGGELLEKTIPLWLENKISPTIQDESKTSFCKKLEWQDGKIMHNDSCENAYAKIRALNPEPGSWLELRMMNNESRMIKIIKANPRNFEYAIHNLKSGLTEINKEPALVLNDGYLMLELVQPEGKRIMTGKEFLNGYRQYITNN